MALSQNDSSKKLDKLLNPLTLQILDHTLEPASSLNIANLLDGTLENSLPIGKSINGKNYLIDFDKAKQQILDLIAHGTQFREAAVQVYNNPPLKGEIPANFPKDYTVNEKGEIFTVAKFNPSNSSDKFYVSLQNVALKGNGTIQVTLKTHNPKNPDSPYQDSVKIDLYEDPNQPGSFLSKPLLLVSKKVFDEDSFQGVDNTSTDQTFLSELGGSVTVTFDDGASQQQSTAEVSYTKILPVHPIIFEDENGNRMATQADVDRQMALAQETLAQAHVKIESSTPIVLKVPPGITLSDGISLFENTVLAQYTYDKVPQTGIRVLFAGNQLPAENNKIKNFGASLTQISSQNPKTQNTVTLSTVGPDETAGHEFVHCLIDSVKDVDYKKLGLDRTGHHTDFLNLLYTSPSGQGLFSSQHLTETQIQAIQSSPRLKDAPVNVINPTYPEYRDGIHLVPKP
jgi:hypothetical protein